MPTWRARGSDTACSTPSSTLLKSDTSSMTGQGVTSTPTMISKIPRSPSPGRKGTLNSRNSDDPKTSPLSNVPFASPSLSDHALHTEKSHKREAEEAAKTVFRQQCTSNHPQYVTTHVGEPCTLGALDHSLNCGHKIMTMRPENCARNCKQSQFPHINPRSLDEPFVCMACITRQISEEHAEKVSSFVAALESVAEATEKEDAEKWIVEKVKIMEMAWRDLELEQMKTRAVGGRFCHAFYIEEEYVDMVNETWTVCRARRQSGETRSEAPVTLSETQSHVKEPTPGASPGLPNISRFLGSSITEMRSRRASKLPIPLK